MLNKQFRGAFVGLIVGMLLSAGGFAYGADQSTAVQEPGWMKRARARSISQIYRELGLQRGDQILSINGQPADNDIKTAFEEIEGRIEVVVERNGQRIVIDYRHSNGRRR